jgi:hypothetical protein
MLEGTEIFFLIVGIALSIVCILLKIIARIKDCMLKSVEAPTPTMTVSDHKCELTAVAPRVIFIFVHPTGVG